MRLITVIKWLIICVATFLLFRAGQAAALAERGYKAVGGEYMLLLLPLIWYAVESCIKDTRAALTQEAKQPKPPSLTITTTKHYIPTTEKTSYIFLECLSCGRYDVLPNKFADGRRCWHCGGHIVPLGYAKRVIK